MVLHVIIKMQASAEKLQPLEELAQLSEALGRSQTPN